MNTSRTLLGLLGVTLLATACTKRAEVAPTAATDSANAARTTASSLAASMAAPVSAAQPVRWEDLDRHGFDTRDLMFTGVRQLEAQVDEQVAALNARRAALPAGTDTQAWDFAMKEMGDSRSYLRSMREELVRSDAATWEQQKAKVGLAWARTQDAYGKVKSSTTS
jgi:hypothetical protein